MPKFWRRSNAAAIHEPVVEVAPARPTSPLSIAPEVDSQEAWTLAKRTYMATLSPEDQSTFINSTLQSVLLEFQVLERLHRSSSISLKVTKVVQPFVNSIKNIDEPMKVFSQVQPSPMCLVWGSVVLLLRIFENWTAGFEHILDMLERIDENLPRIQRYADTFPQSKQLQVAVSKVYLDIIHFCMEGRNFFKNIHSLNTAKIGFRTLWDPLEAHFKVMLSKFKEHRLLVEDSAFAAFIEDARENWIKEDRERSEAQRERVLADESRQAVNKGLLKADAHYAASSRFYEESTIEKKKTNHRTITRWLSPVSVAANYHNLKARRTDGTCHWINDRPEVALLTDSPKEAARRLLWIFGKSGSGKSVLASKIIQEFGNPSSESLDMRSDQIMLYFFCSRGDQRRNKSMHIVGSFLAQIITQKRDLLHIAESIYDASLTGPDDIDALWAAFLETLKDTTRVILVIDGLDECEDHEEITRRVELALPKVPNLSAIFLCRPELKATDDWKNTLCIALTTHIVETDLRIFTESAVSQRLFIEDHDFKRSVTESLVQKADGMFLWIKLMIDMLSEASSVGEVQAALENLPNGVDEAYRLIVRRFTFEPRGKREIIARILRWVALSARPLTVEELSLAFMVKAGMSKPDDASRLLAPRDFLTRVCGSFIEVLPTNVIQFVHTSARDYLLQGFSIDDKSAFADFVVDDVKTNHEIAKTCISYLSYDAFEEDAFSDKADLKSVCKEYPLLDYASRFWTYHLASSNVADVDLLKLVVRFINTDQGISWANGPVYALESTLSPMLIVQAQLNDWASLFPEGTPGVDALHDVLGRLFQVAYDEALKRHGTYSHVACEAMIALGLLKLGQGKAAEAQPPLKLAVEVKSYLFGEKHTKTLNCVNNLALAEFTLGHLDESESLFRRATQGWIEDDGPDSENAYFGLGNLGMVLRRQWKLDEAQATLERVVSGMTELHGLKHPDTLRSLAELGLVALDQKNYLAAVESLEKCRHNALAALGKSDQLTLNASIALCSALSKFENRREEASQLFNELLQEMDRVFGPDHPDTLESMMEHAKHFRRIGDLEQSIKLGEETASRQADTLGKSHYSTAETIHSLGKAYMVKGDLQKAQALLREATEIRSKYFGETDPRTLKSARGLQKAEDLLYPKVPVVAFPEEFMSAAKPEQHSMHISSNTVLAV